MKQQDSEIDAVFLGEEQSVLSHFDRAATSTPGTHGGLNGEIPIIDFLNRYLPRTMTAVTGRIGTPVCEYSNLVDILVLDCRYPLLSQYADGSALVPLHAVIATVGVRLALDAASLKEVLAQAAQVRKFSDYLQKSEKGDGLPGTYGLFYYAGIGMAGMEGLLKENREGRTCPDLTVLRLHPEDLANCPNYGVTIHERQVTTGSLSQPATQSGISISPQPGSLHEFYSRLVASACSVLNLRDYDPVALHERLSEYKEWSCFSLEELSPADNRSLESGRTDGDNMGPGSTGTTDGPEWY
jgi:hypothetical protein